MAVDINREKELLQSIQSLYTIFARHKSLMRNEKSTDPRELVNENKRDVFMSTLQNVRSELTAQEVQDGHFLYEENVSALTTGDHNFYLNVETILKEKNACCTAFDFVTAYRQVSPEIYGLLFDVVVLSEETSADVREGRGLRRHKPEHYNFTYGRPPIVC